MTKLYNNADGSVTVGPADKHRDLVAVLEEYASHANVSKEECRRLAWFLGDKGEQAAAEAIMRHAKVVEFDWTQTPWGYFPAPRVP